MTDAADQMIEVFGWETGVIMPRDVDRQVVHRTIAKLLENGLSFAVLATQDKIEFFTYADAYFERCLPERGRDGVWRFGCN